MRKANNPKIKITAKNISKRAIFEKKKLEDAKYIKGFT